MTQNEDADQYEVIEFPAILEKKLPDGTIKERALWPEFFDLDALHRTKASMPVFQWNAQYQQNPTAEGSALVKREWWRRWKETKPPEVSYIIMALDTATEEKQRADYTALTVWGVFFNEEEHANQLILLEAIRRRVEFPELKKLAVEQYRSWEPDAFIVEKKNSGVALFQELRRTGMVLQEYMPHRGSGNKYARLQSVADIVAAGIVWVPETRWAEELVEEIAAFPVGSHDDLVDSTVIALMRFRQGGFLQLKSDDEVDIQGEYIPYRAAYY
jgi:predicted phage terminase large subunit-like protein